MRHLLPLILALALSGCAQPATIGPKVDKAEFSDEVKLQRRLAWDAERNLLRRLNRVGVPLLQAAVPLCPKNNLSYEYGFVFIAPGDLPRDKQELIIAAHALGRYPKVIEVMPGMAADRAGLREGDEMTVIEGRALSGDEGARAAVVEVVEKAGRAGVPLSLTVSRQGAFLDLKIPPSTVCAYRLALVMDDMVNAFADGKRMVVTSGMINFAASDQELALVVGHEIAHNLGGHVQAAEANEAGGFLMGTIIDILLAGGGLNSGGRFGDLGSAIGARAYSQAFEAESDYVGLYLMARAGMPIEGAANFWRRIGAKSFSSISHGTTHPPTAYRFSALEATVAEIEAKLAKGEPLVPNGL